MHRTALLLALLLANAVAPCSAALAARPSKKGKKGKGSGGRGFGAKPAAPVAAPTPAASQPPMVATPTPAASSGPVRAPTERERAFLGASAHNTGMALLAKGKYEEAGLAFEKALDENEDALDTWSALGVCMHELGQQDAALVCQRQVRALLTALCPAARSADLAQSTPRSLTHARRCRAPQVQRIQASEAHQAAQREREAEVSELAAVGAAAIPPLPDGRARS